MIIQFLYTGLLQGLVLSIVAFGIMIPFRFLKFADLTAEGAYPLGGAIVASLLVAHIPPILAILLGMLASGLLAIGTAQVALRMKVNSLLAGIILSTMAYSINLRIMGKPNIALFNTQLSVFSNNTVLFIILILVPLLCVLGFAFFLHTDLGLRFRAVGLNPRLAFHYKISINKYMSIGLFMAGALFGLAAGLMVQMQQYMDIGMGIGIVIHGLASLMVGEAIIGKQTLRRQLMAPIVGALVYQQIQGIALFCGLAPTDLKFFTASIVLICIGFAGLATPSKTYDTMQ